MTDFDDDYMFENTVELENEMVLELDDEVSEEIRVTINFLSTTCRCKYANGEPCSSLFTAGQLLEFRQQSSAIDYYEGSVNKLDLVLLGLLRALCVNSEKTKRSNQRNTERIRTRTKFHLNGVPVCENTFLFAHTMSPMRFKRIKKNYLEDGLVEIRHGNSGRLY